MSNNFDLKKFLVENKLTTNSKFFNEQGEDLESKDIAAVGNLLQKIKSLQFDDEDIPDVQKDIKEGLGGLAFGVVLSAPKILEGLAWIASQINKYLHSKKIQIAADKFEHWAHSLHHSYEGAFTFIAKKLIVAAGSKNPDPKHVNLLANALFTLVIAYAFYGAAGVAAQLNGVISTLEGALAGVKGTELVQLVKQVGSQLVKVAGTLKPVVVAA